MRPPGRRRPARMQRFGPGQPRAAVFRPGSESAGPGPGRAGAGRLRIRSLVWRQCHGGLPGISDRAGKFRADSVLGLSIAVSEVLFFSRSRFKFGGCCILARAHWPHTGAAVSAPRPGTRWQIRTRPLIMAFARKPTLRRLALLQQP
eukprot:763304-Hanusia_phi.AAC.1